MAEQEYTPTLADMLEGLVYSQLEIGKRGHGDMDLAVAEQELRRRWAEALAAHDAWVRADERAKTQEMKDYGDRAVHKLNQARFDLRDERAKRPDRDAVPIIDSESWGWGYCIACGGGAVTHRGMVLLSVPDTPTLARIAWCEAEECIEDRKLTVAFPVTPRHVEWIDSALALEPEAREEKPPVYLASDLWSALQLPDAEFDGYYERNGWADTWSNLLAEVRLRSGARSCGEDADGEPCVLMTESHLVHYGASDVGSSEPLPAPEAREEPKLAEILARAEEVHQDDGWGIGGAWGDYGEVVVPLRILSYVIEGELDQKVASIDPGFALTYAEQVRRAETAEEKLAEAREVTDAGIDAARAVITALAPYNMELRPDGSEDRQAAAYVSGVQAASDAIPEALRAAWQVSHG